MPYSDEDVISQSRQWIKTVIIELNLCPFAQREVTRDSIRMAVCRDKKLATALATLMAEVNWLEAHPDIETTLLIFPILFRTFESYLDMLELAEGLLTEQGFEGIYQLASFHPDYCFADASPDDPGNYTNRSPYPMLHLLREASLSDAIAGYGDTARIPERNLARLEAIGSEAAEQRLANCFSAPEEGSP